MGFTKVVAGGEISAAFKNKRNKNKIRIHFSEYKVLEWGWLLTCVKGYWKKEE